MIWNAILKLTWFIFIQGPLNLISAFTKVLEYLTGGIINDILFGSEKDFTWKNIPIQFWWFVIIALCLFGLIFTTQMIILLFKEAVETKAKFVMAIQNGVKGFCFMFLIPIFFFLANFIIQNIANTVINNFGNGSNLADYLYHIGDPKWNGSPTNNPSFPVPGNIGDYNIIAQLFGTWFMLYAIFMIGIILVQKIIELFFLFIISPVVMIVMVIDNGKAAFTWKDMVGAKFLASTATLIGYYVFISVTQLLLSSNLNSLNEVAWAKQLFIILFLCGGGLATMAFSDIVANFLGESVGIREGRSSLKSTIAGGMMAMGAGQMVARGLGFMKNKRSQNSGILGSNFNGSDIGDNPKLNTENYRNASVGMGARSGIIGLSGLALGLAGHASGSMVSGIKNTWNSGDRTSAWGKTKGVGRLLAKTSVAPIVVPTKMMTRGFKNTSKITKNSFKDNNKANYNNYGEYLSKKSKSHQKMANKVNNKLIKKNWSEKKWMKNAKKVDENYQKFHELEIKSKHHNDEKS